jgi:hypothetical protein
MGAAGSSTDSVISLEREGELRGEVKDQVKFPPKVI